MIVKMNEFGSNLTGRTYGKEALLKLKNRGFVTPVSFDFDGVRSMGSSFAEEVVPFLIGSDRTVIVFNVTKAVRDCLKDLEDDFKFQVLLKE